MTNVPLERLYDSVTLVPRIGRRQDGELCVMSLVALLANERHTDRPGTACPAIAAFAIKINDSSDDATRQALKPFAPRMIGTRDSFTRARVLLLVDAMLREVLPHIIRERGSRPSIAVLRKLRLSGADFDRDEIRTLSNRLREEAEALHLDRGTVAEFRYMLRGCARGADAFVAGACATLLINQARLAPADEAGRWYRNKGIELLDRLCDIGDAPYQGVALTVSRAVREADQNRTATVYRNLPRQLFARARGR